MYRLETIRAHRVLKIYDCNQTLILTRLRFCLGRSFIKPRHAINDTGQVNITGVPDMDSDNN